ncbi:hypothetical protein CK240_17770 [Paracoccus salipaludis]|uniref:Uncharacterized protein n=2 Tax=Paracoccus salipaludis TaxID=2032623 RepID=A0A2A2G5L8_9RHOB|nr:hypothetical protein CK240_17770 [Paracoccus salipaludis]
MTRSLAERLHERLESQTAEIAALTENELQKLSRRVSASVSTELTEIEIAIVQSTHGIRNALPQLKWILGLTWGAMIVSLSLTGFLLWRSTQPLRIVADMPLETFQSEGQSYLVVPENAKPLQCTTPSGRTAICLHLTNGE